MKYQKIIDQYDKIYSDDTNPFGNNPLRIVRALVEQLQKGTVLEIGAGAGRNSLFLAAQGFEVLATDISPVSVALMQRRAQAEKLPLRVELLNITEADLAENFDAIICTFTLHHLERADALATLKKCKHTPSPAGIMF